MLEFNAETKFVFASLLPVGKPLIHVGTGRRYKVVAHGLIEGRLMHPPREGMHAIVGLSHMTDDFNVVITPFTPMPIDFVLMSMLLVGGPVNIGRDN